MKKKEEKCDVPKPSKGLWFCGLIFVMTVTSVVVSGLIVVSCLYGVILSNVNPHQIIIHEGAVTFLSFGTSIDSLFYDQVTLEIQPLFTARDQTISFNVCQLDCPNDMLLRKHSEHLNQTESITRRFSGLLSLLHFRDITDYNDAVEASEYMLGQSTVNVTIEHSNIPQNSSAKLFIYDNSETCDRHFTDPTYHSNTQDHLQVLTFDENNQSSLFIINKESYICGVWEIPLNYSITYHVATTIYHYNISYYENHERICLSTTCEAKPGVNVMSCDVPIKRNNVQLRKRNICFLVTRQDTSTSDVQITSSAHRTLNNAGFIIPLMFTGTGVIAVLFIVCVSFRSYVSRRIRRKGYSVLINQVD